MTVKKICFFLSIFCFISCNSSETKTSAKDNTTTEKTANKPQVKITPGQGGEKKVSLGSAPKVPTAKESKPAENPSTKNSKVTFKEGYYQSSKFRFKIKQPKNWEVLENQRENVPITFMNRPKGARTRGVESISVAVEGAQNVSLDTYYNYCKNQLIQSGETTGIIEESIGKSLDGKVFKRIIFNRRPNPTPAIAISFIYVENNITYTITCSAENQKYNIQRGLFEDIAASIKFE